VGETLGEDGLSKIPQDNQVPFEPLFDQYFDRVFRYVFSRTNNRQVAEDLTSQIFLKIFEALPRYQSRRPMAAWIFTIARNTLFSHYRFTFHHPMHSLEIVKSVFSNSLNGLGGINGDIDHYIDLEKAINKLPKKELELLHLRYAAGLSLIEIGELLGKSPNAIKMAFHRVLRKLEDEMEFSK
jgi:RNA polymerase sigma-70 factor (ECF subfamily)